MILRSSNSVLERSLSLMYHLEALAAKLTSKSAAVLEESQKTEEVPKEERTSGQAGDAAPEEEETKAKPIVETEVVAEL